MMHRLFPILALLASMPASHAALVVWYDFEQTSGTILTDQSGNSRNMTLQGSNTLGITGVFGNGANIDDALARTGGASASTITSLNSVTGNQVTIAFWARVNSESIGSNPFYISDSSTSGGNRIFSAHLEWTDGNIYWDAAWNASNTNRTSVAGGAVSDAYHHYVMTYDGTAGDLFLYKDNVLLSSNTSAAGGAINWAGIRNFELGALSFSNGAWGGAMDDFAIWNEVIDTNTRNAIFTNGVASVVPEPSTLALVGLGTLGLLRRRR